MRSISILSLATVTALAFAPAAFAQDTATAQQDIYGNPVSNETASGKHWAVVGSATILQPKSDPATGVKKLDGDVAPTISASYFINDNWAVELWGAADKFNHRVKSDAGKIGTVEQQPVALSAQYHFGQADNTFRPFVGVGYYESKFSNEKIDALAGADGRVGVDKAKGAIGTVGVDMNINSTWFARADARYMHARPDVTVGGEGTGQDLKLDPWTVGVGIGARF
ncbi:MULTISPECIES: OmpW/AlkL family protein [Gammaproteobacteria]|uniref:Membrane protein n=1 Tax=Xanthomonas boreopolis TaxID=86183 RepID=A0A919F9U9_9XANT|nr:OmpW family outer membrane protein [Pseudomonas sp. Hp2]GHH58062.1 membrane protein [[Pseudomonas] boreopolis]